MVRSSWPTRRSALKAITPQTVPIELPDSSKSPSLISSARRFQWLISAVRDEAAICVDTVATATAGGMPRKISKGVIKNPPPTPNRPEIKPTTALIPTMSQILTGNSAMGR